jgi:hypothetical protein
MSQYYLNIFADLMEINPTTPLVMPDPYNTQHSLSTNVRMFYRIIRWSLGTGDRIGTLVNAYYLGYLLEERASTPNERRKCRKLLTKHYVLSCTRVYNLYNFLGVQQLYRSQRSSYWMFRKLSRKEFCQLLQEAGTML